MNALSWRRPPLAQQLSAYLDDELDERETAQVAECLVFDPEARQLLRAYGQLDELTGKALAPARPPDPEGAAVRLHQALSREAGRPAVPARSRQSARRRLGTAALLASIGLLLTAGVALVGLRRRGLV